MIFWLMGILKTICFTFNLLFLAIHARNDCQTSLCGKNPLLVRFPFRLQGQQPKKCGYPDFDLNCTSQGSNSKLVLNLPYCGDFWVRDIDYLFQEIQLYDPNGCLARRFLSLNLSSSPFMTGFSKNYTFLSCPSELVRSRFKRIDCLSNVTTSVLATSSMNLAAALNICSTIVTLPLPVLSPQYSEWLTSDSIEDLRLTWHVPRCQDCESRGGICGVENSSNIDQILCYTNKTGKPGGLKIFKVVVVSIVVPAILCSFCIACFIFMVERRRSRDSIHAATMPPPVSATITGLDDSTIESYSKVVLGESRRLPGPNGATCPICLADYRPKDTLRCLPQCEHCFHSGCIDEWLRRHGSCPVCRNSPSPTHG